MAGAIRWGVALAAAMGTLVATWCAASWTEWRLLPASAPSLGNVEPIELTLDGARYSMLVSKGMRLREAAVRRAR